MKSGMLAAEALHSALSNEEKNDSVAVSGEEFFSKARPAVEIQQYETGTTLLDDFKLI